MNIHVLVEALLRAETLCTNVADVRLQIVRRVVGEYVRGILAGGHDGPAVLAGELLVKAFEVTIKRVLKNRVEPRLL